MSSPIPYIRTRLSAMMFLEFMLWASWYVPIGGYMNTTLGFAGWQMGLINATTAIGAILAPMFVGYVADRLFATERILAVLHLVGGVCLLLASLMTHFSGLMVLLVVNALCFMPTLALCNSLSFRNIDDPDRFSRIAVWGTIGWILSGWIVDLLLGGAETGRFFYLAGGGAIAMGLYCLSLPHTPPKGAEAAPGDVMGLGALKLLKEKSFLIFAVCAFLICIPVSFYFVWGHAFLTETDRPLPTTLMTLCQVSEIVMMLVMPWFIGRIGLKNVLVIGMCAWAVRYLLFATNFFPLVLLALLLHGFCYCFVFVASFIYVSKKAPPEISSSAQSLVALLMWGVGMLIGTQMAGFAGGHYAPPTIVAEKQTPDGIELVKEAALPSWDAFKAVETKRMPLAVADPDNQATMVAAGQPVMVVGQLEVLGQVPDKLKIEKKNSKGEVLRDKEGRVIETLTYAKSDLVEKLKEADTAKNGVVTRSQWKAFTTHTWPPIWLWPGVLAAIVAGLFWFGGRDVSPAGQEEATAPAKPREEPPPVILTDQESPPQG